MASSIKWIVLGLLSAVLSVILYKTIDSQWAAERGIGVWITIAFFLTATGTILCGFNLVDARNQPAKE